MPFAFRYLARSSSSANVDAGKMWIYNGTATGSNETMATITAAGYFDAAQVTLLSIFPAGQTGSTGSFAANDTIQINANNSSAVYTIPSVTGAVALTVLDGGGTITGADSLGGESLYGGVTGSLIDLKGLVAGTNITLTSNASTVTIDASGGGALPYISAYWVSALVGNDANTGLSVEDPVATFQHAINLFDNGGAPATAACIFYGMDSGQTFETIFCQPNGRTLYIEAPGMIFAGSIDSGYSDLRVRAAGINNLISQFNGCRVTAGFLGISTITTTTYINVDQCTGLWTCSNVASVFINCKTSITIANDGTCAITGMAGNLALGAGLSVSDTLGSSTQYTLTTDTPTGANEVLVSSGAGPNATTSWAAGIISHPYTAAFWVDDVNGNDANSGLNINAPFLTYQKAVTDATTTPTIIYGINCNGNNNETITTTGAGQFIIFDTPGVVFSGIFTIAATDSIYITSNYLSQLFVDGYGFARVNQMIVTVNLGGNLKVESTGPLTIINDGGTVTANSGSQASTFNVTNLASTSYLSGLWLTLINDGNSYVSGQVASVTNPLSGLIVSSSPEMGVTSNAGVIRTVAAIGSVMANTGTISGIISDKIYAPLGPVEGGFITSVISVSVNDADLATAAIKNVIVAEPIAGGGTQGNFVISNIYLNFGGSNWTVGDRDIDLTDGVTVYTTIPTASLLAVPGNTAWGAVPLPFPTAAAINVPTVGDLFLEYSGGTTDYTSGSITLTVVYARVA